MKPIVYQVPQVQVVRCPCYYGKMDIGGFWNAIIINGRWPVEDDLNHTQPLIVIDAINRQLAHYSYHAGQIVYRPVDKG